jgi:hypothetical protein
MPTYDARVNRAGVAGVAGVLAPTKTDESIIGVAKLAPVDVAEIYLQSGRVLWKGTTDEESAIKFAVMLAAGRQAELLHAGIGLTGELRISDPDHRQARELLQRTGQRLSMRYVQLLARHYLSHHWAEVETIATELTQNGYWVASHAQDERDQNSCHNVSNQ